MKSDSSLGTRASRRSRRVTICFGHKKNIKGFRVTQQQQQQMLPLCFPKARPKCLPVLGQDTDLYSQRFCNVGIGIPVNKIQL